MSYKIVIDSCGELLDEWKKDEHIESREFDSFGSPNASQSLIRLYFFCQFLILYFHVMPSYVIITMR